MPAAQPWKTAEDSTWWSTTGKTTLAAPFTNALALALPGGKFAVMTSPGVMETVAATAITAATRMAVVDAEWVARAQSQGADLNEADRRLSEVGSVCQGYLSRAQPHPAEVTEMLNRISKTAAAASVVTR